MQRHKKKTDFDGVGLTQRRLTSFFSLCVLYYSKLDAVWGVIGL